MSEPIKSETTDRLQTRETMLRSLRQARAPRDGQPYYCDLCGAGLGEFMACEETDCRLESIEAAQERANAA